MTGNQSRWLVFYVATVFILHRGGGDCARILGVFPFTAQSHFVVFQSLMHELARRGHDVVVISHFPQREMRPNYTDISLAGSMDTYLNNVPFSTVAMSSWNPFNGLQQLHHFLHNYEPIFHTTAIQRLLSSDEHFDLIFVELFNTDMFLGFVHKFKVPFIYISSSNLLPWSYTPFGSPDNPAYMPVIFQPYSDHMTFQERLLNTMHNVASILVYKYIFAPYSESVARRYFGPSLPPLGAISNNASLLLVNSHHTLHRPKPFMPSIVEVGGIHLKAPSRLPQDLADFMNSSKDGVVYFCLGSMLRAETLPDAKRQLFMQAFARIPKLNFLWKWEGQGPFAGQPSNLKTVAWLPQQDVLAHPKMRVFISHGGLLGTTEAIYNGVPILGIPMYGDQGNNLAAVVTNGAGIMLDYDSLSADSVHTALKKLLDDPGEDGYKLSASWKPVLYSLIRPKSCDKNTEPDSEPPSTENYKANGDDRQSSGVTQTIGFEEPPLGLASFPAKTVPASTSLYVANGVTSCSEWTPDDVDNKFDETYQASAQRLSQLFQDRPRPPLETAVYWTEYVLRHRDMSHLRSAAVNLPWYQYFLLDVATACLLAATLTAVLLFVAIRIVVQFIFPHFITVRKTKND